MIPAPPERTPRRVLALTAWAALVGCGEAWTPEQLGHTSAALTPSTSADEGRADRPPKPLELTPPPGVFRVVSLDDVAIEGPVPTIAAGPCYGCWVFDLRASITDPEALLDVASARLRLRHILGESTVEIDGPDYRVSCVDKTCTVSLYVPRAAITPRLWVADAADLTVDARVPGDGRFARRTLRPEIVRVAENNRLQFGPGHVVDDIDFRARIPIDEDDLLRHRDVHKVDDPR